MNSKSVQRLIDDLRAAHGENLLSITLYGSTAAGDTDDAGSEHNVLVVLRNIGLEDLRQSVEPVRAWTRAGQPMPVYFSAAELQRAADVFPIEFLQMQKARKVLHGSDPFEFAEITDANLRHQTEYELRTKFVQLRRLYLPAARSAEKLMTLMSDSISSFVALFRAALLLKGHDAPTSKRDAVHAAAEVFAFDPVPLDRILDLAGDRQKLAEPAANELFAAYLEQIQKVIDAVDQIDDEGKSVAR
jgi:hypothetical protein